MINLLEFWKGVGLQRSELTSETTMLRVRVYCRPAGLRLEEAAPSDPSIKIIPTLGKSVPKPQKYLE